MGGASSRRRNRNTPIPTYQPAAGGSPGIARPGVAVTPAIPVTGGFPVGGAASFNPAQQRELMQLNQSVANLATQVQAMQRTAGMGSPYGGYPMPGAASPSPYGGYPGGAPPMVPYGTPPAPYGFPTMPMLGGGGAAGAPPAAPFRETDFASIANVAGLNPADIALLYREFMNLTHGGATKIDRVIFRQILRDVLLQASNEHVDRVIENMFVTIDRNHDGFIDFSEFVGAFKDVLKERPSDPESYFDEHVYPDLLTEQLRASGVGSGIAAQPISYMPQVQAAAAAPAGLNIVPLASMAIPQTPLVYGGAATIPISDASAPFLTFDQSQSTCVIATPGQYLITQPTALQCIPLPMM